MEANTVEELASRIVIGLVVMAAWLYFGYLFISEYPITSAIIAVVVFACWVSDNISDTRRRNKES